jgi:hypothetical protein
MHDHVPDVQRVIEKDNGEHHVNGCRQSGRVQESEAAPLDRRREMPNERPLQEVDCCRAQTGEDEISRYAANR